MAEKLNFRYRWTCQVLYGHMTDFMDLQHRKVEIGQARGWPPPRFWVSTAGNLNDFTIERGYETLGGLARELAEREKDFEFMKLMRQSYVHLVQGSVRTEILESLDRPDVPDQTRVNDAPDQARVNDAPDQARVNEWFTPASVILDPVAPTI